MRRQTKLLLLEELEYACPGCGQDFSHLDEERLLAVFTRGHIHREGCIARSDHHWGWLCLNCNALQADRCGRYVNGAFIAADCAEERKEMERPVRVAPLTRPIGEDVPWLADLVEPTKEE